jgi:hypothetical protein
MNKITNRALLFVCTSILAISTAQGAAKNSSRVLQYVPADTPYVIASTKPLPTALADKLEPTINEILQVYQQILRYSLESQLAELAEEDRDGEDLKKVQGIADEVIGLMSLEGLRAAGIERDSAFVLYGNGITPVIRLELSDPDLFDAAIAGIEEQAGTRLSEAEADGNAYRFVDMDGVNLIIATLDEQAVITVVPSSFDESQVALALGIDKPAKSLRKSKALAAVGKEYGFAAALTGFIDSRRIAEILTGDIRGLDADLFDALGEQRPQMSAVCTSEIMEMVGIAPRIVFGYTELSTERIDSSFIVELREDIAAGLTAIPTPVPGLGEDPGGLISIGMGIDLMEVRNFVKARLDAMEADPYECEKFAELQAGVAQGHEMLNQPIPPMVYSFRGFVANIVEMEGLDLSKSQPPESIDASVLIAIENAEALLMMASMMDPRIAALNLQSDGKPVKLELEALASLAETAYAAMSSNALAIAMGSGAKSKSADMLVAESLDPLPFIATNVDAGRYYEMIGDAMAQSPKSADVNEVSDDAPVEEMPAVIRDAIREVMRLSGSIYDRFAGEVYFTDRGIEISASGILND